MQRHKLIALLVTASGAVACAAAQAGEIAVVVNPKSPLANLTPEQVSALYFGNALTYPDGSTPALTDQSSASPLRETFYQKVSGRSAGNAKAVWARLTFNGKAIPPKELKDSSEVKAFVASNPRAIGYIDAADADGAVKVVLALKD